MLGQRRNIRTKPDNGKWFCYGMQMIGALRNLPLKETLPPWVLYCTPVFQYGTQRLDDSTLIWRTLVAQ